MSINPGVKLRLAGKLTLLSVVELEGRFTLDIQPGLLEITLVASLKINPIGQLQATGGLRINSAGVVLYADLAMNTNFGDAIGLRFSASAHLEFNATNQDQTLNIDGTDYLVRRGLLVRIDGSIEFLGFASANGYAEFSFTPTETRILFGIGFSLGGLTFRADGGAEVAYGNDPGLALFLNVEAKAEAGEIFRIAATGTIQINTTNSTRLGIQGNSFLLSLNGEVRILELLIFDAGFTVRVANGGWRFDFNAEIDFFGIVTINGHGFLDSKGNFDITLQGRFVIGTDDFGLSGQATFRVWNVTTFGSVRQPDLRLRAVDRRQPAGSPVRHHARRRRLQRHVHREQPRQHLGSRRDQAQCHRPDRDPVRDDQQDGDVLARLAPAAAAGVPRRVTPTALTSRPPSPNWNPDWATDGDPNTDGTLYLNVGSRASIRNISEDVTDEVYYIGDGGFDDAGRRLIKVSAFGRTNTFANVTQIDRLVLRWRQRPALHRFNGRRACHDRHGRQRRRRRLRRHEQHHHDRRWHRRRLHRIHRHDSRRACS